MFQKDLPKSSVKDALEGMRLEINRPITGLLDRFKSTFLNCKMRIRVTKTVVVKLTGVTARDKQDLVTNTGGKGSEGGSTLRCLPDSLNSLGSLVIPFISIENIG